MQANFCWNCGQKLEDGVHFCPQCGTAIQSEDTKRSISESIPIKPGTQSQTGSDLENPAIVRKWTQIGSLGAALAQENTSAFQNMPEQNEPIPSAYAPSGAAQQFHRLMASFYIRSGYEASQHAGVMNSAMGESQLFRQNQPLRDGFQVEGTWSYQLPLAPYGVVNYQLFMDSPTHFACQSTLNGFINYDMGTLQHQGNFLHFVVKEHEPKVRNGKKEHWITSWGYYYTVVDANKMIFEDRLAGGGKFYVYRVQGQ